MRRWRRPFQTLITVVPILILIWHTLLIVRQFPQEAEPGIAQRPQRDRDRGEPDDEGQALPEHVVERVAREPPAAHVRYFSLWAATSARIRSTGHCSTKPR